MSNSPILVHDSPVHSGLMQAGLVRGGMADADLAQSGGSLAVKPTGSAFLPASQAAATDGLVLAQQFNQDILGDVGVAFENFVETGQIWALLIGFVLGYVFKSLTSYG